MKLIGALFLGALITAVTCKNVLIVDTVGSPSHQVWMHRLARAVAEHGYNTTILSYTQVKSPPQNLHVYEVKNLYDMDGAEDYNALDMNELGPWETFFMYTNWYDLMDTFAMESPAVHALMDFPESFHFDLILFDYLAPLSYLVLADRYPRAKLIGVSPYPAIEYTNKYTKGPYFPAIEPHFFMAEIGQGFWGRLESFLMYSVVTFMDHFKFYPQSEKIVKQHFNLTRSLTEIGDTMTVLLANHHPVLDTVTPILPGVIPVGGLQIEAPKPLPADLEEVFQSAQKGVVLFALGSNVKSEMLGRERLEVIINALAQFPDYHFVWKIDLSKLELEMPKNVFIRTWLPQNDILADKRTKLFISHAGGLSTQEATWYGKPMLAIPIMFDQEMNAEKAVKSGMALQLDVKSLKTDEFVSTLHELLHNTKYSSAAELRSKNFQDQMQTPMERALWWIDFVERNEDVSFLQNEKMKNMSFIPKHSIDVVVFITTVVLSLIIICVKCICFCCPRKTSIPPKLKKN